MEEKEAKVSFRVSQELAHQIKPAALLKRQSLKEFSTALFEEAVSRELKTHP